MPDVPNRTEEEQALAGTLAPLFQSWQADAADALGDPPSADRLGPAFYEGHANRVAALLEPALLRFHGESALRISDLTNTEHPLDEASEASRAWAHERARALANSLATRVRSQVHDAVLAHQRQQNEAVVAAILLDDATRRRASSVAKVLRDGGQVEDLEVGRSEIIRTPFADRLSAIFGPSRSDAIAKTEITHATSAGESDSVRRIADKHDLTLVATWVIDPRSNVCPICLKLDGKPEDVWRDRYPKGPPAHPNCACHISYLLAGPESN